MQQMRAVKASLPPDDRPAVGQCLEAWCPPFLRLASQVQMLKLDFLATRPRARLVGCNRAGRKDGAAVVEA